MMKIFSLFIMLSSCWIKADTYSAYLCEYVLGDIDVGYIEIYGDPIENIYSDIIVDEVNQNFKYGSVNRSQLYLYSDVLNGSASYAFEMVNPQDSSEKFEIALYGEEQIFIADLKIATYVCQQVE